MAHRVRSIMVSVGLDTTHRPGEFKTIKPMLAGSVTLEFDAAAGPEEVAAARAALLEDLTKWRAEYYPGQVRECARLFKAAEGQLAAELKKP